MYVCVSLVSPACPGITHHQQLHRHNLIMLPSFLLIRMFLSDTAQQSLVSHAGGNMYSDDVMIHSLMTVCLCHAADIAYRDDQ